MDPIYFKAGVRLGVGLNNDPNLVRALQRDLRALGYLPASIDGSFGENTERAVRALQNDILGRTTPGSDGSSPVTLSNFNNDGHGGKFVVAVTGILDQGLAACMASILADETVVLLPCSGNSIADNQRALDAIESISGNVAPVPFVVAIVRQESQARHFNVPGMGDDDQFVTLGLDRNDKTNRDHITSRGYGIGQYTFFHHPISGAELASYVSDPVLNVQDTFSELRVKFDKFISGPSDRADDRVAEHPALPLRLCKYQPGDPLYMRNCKACAIAARKVNISRGTPFYQGAAGGYQPDQYYPSAEYIGVPDRADFLCDWPYASRRYNGSGNDSFHYQTRILLNLLR